MGAFQHTFAPDPLTLPSYLTLDEANLLLPGLPKLTHFTAAKWAARVGQLALASLRIDASQRWQGRKCSPDQELEFPRYIGPPTATTPVVPPAIKIATIYEADSIADGERDRIIAAISAGLTGQSTGSVSEQYRQVIAGQAGPTPLCDEAERLVARFRLTTGSFI